MLWSSDICELYRIASSVADGTRPTGSMGTAIGSITQNDIASAGWNQVLTALPYDCHRLRVGFNSIGVSGAARNCITEIGYDPAGGSSYTHLCYQLPGPASGYVGNTGPGYFADILCDIPAGSTVAARASVNSATLTGIRCIMDAYGLPSPSHLFRPARRIEDLGFTTGSSTGTSVTSGTTSEGSWAEIGTLTIDAFAFEFGLGFQDSAANSNGIDVDIAFGDASNKHEIIRNHPVTVTNTEALWKLPALTYARVAAGNKIYARCQTGPSAAPSGLAVAVTAMGY